MLIDMNIVLRIGILPLAIGYAHEKGHIKTMKHLFSIVTKRGIRLTADDLVHKLLRDAVQSGNPKKITLVVELAAEHGVEFNSQHFGLAMEAAVQKNKQVVQRVV